MSRRLRARLLAWYDRHARDLPWRQTRDPYAIWVSEIMLQQTRVDTVIPFYQRFLERFPTLESLASTPEDEVLAAWSGLGYYRRARLLHRGVQEVVASYGGQVPRSADARQALPGVGRYTAGAIGSIAFDQPEAVVDGNVSRVLARLYGVETQLGRSETTKRLWALAEELAQGERPGAFNQALMELGATVCTPREANCGVCPVRRFCVAYQDERVAELPVPPSRKAPRVVKAVAVVATAGSTSSQNQRVWMMRGDDALYGGLWGVPFIECPAPSLATARRLLVDVGIQARFRARLVHHVRHELTHRRFVVSVFHAYAARADAAARGRFLLESALQEVGVSKLTAKLLDTLKQRNHSLAGSVQTP